LLFGLVGTGTELLLIGHDEDGWQRVRWSWSPFSVLASLGMVTLRSTSAAVAVTRLFRGAMVLLMLSGAAGLVLHYRASLEFKREMDPSLSGFALFSSVVQAKAPPALSPGTLALLGLLGFACVFRLNPPASPRSS
jgi:hypothetical protein